LVLVGDIAQLPPVNDKVLYYKSPSNDVATQGYMAFRSFQITIKLEENHRITSESESLFKGALQNMRNGTSTVDDWKCFQPETNIFLMRKLEVTIH